jgi:hypothetical protein
MALARFARPAMSRVCPERYVIGLNRQVKSNHMKLLVKTKARAFI